jgi:hypothetical protein
MQVTQIFFNRIEVDGRTWAAVISDNGRGRTFHSLRGKSAAQSEAPQMGGAVVTSVGGAAKITGSMAMFAVNGHEAVMYAQDADRR